LTNLSIRGEFYLLTKIVNKLKFALGYRESLSSTQSLEASPQKGKKAGLGKKLNVGK